MKAQHHKNKRTSDESSEIQPGLNQMQKRLHRSIIIRDITAVPIKKGRVIGRGGGRKRLVLLIFYLFQDESE